MCEKRVRLRFKVVDLTSPKRRKGAFGANMVGEARRGDTAGARVTRTHETQSHIYTHPQINPMAYGSPLRHASFSYAPK